jgi:hypothetical protein
VANTISTNKRCVPQVYRGAVKSGRDFGEKKGGSFGLVNSRKNVPVSSGTVLGAFRFGKFPAVPRIALPPSLGKP